MKVHITTNRRCEPHERFVEANDFDPVIPNPACVDEIEADPDKVIVCYMCGKPARVLDFQWPYGVAANRCADHDDFERYPIAE